MIKQIASLGLAAALSLAAAGLSRAEDAHETPKPPEQKWSFSGPFGTFDRAQLQRGFQVYREVCSNCHSLSIPFRTLAEPGGPEFTQAQVKALAAEYKVKDGPNDAGEMFERPALPSDKIPYAFDNPQAAAAAIGAYPPPMRVLAKARTYERGFPLFLWDIVTQYQEQGQDYIYAILNGYEEPPAGVTIDPGLNYNKYMPGHKIAMAKPLSDDQVTYADGSPQTVDQYARDVVSFLSWAADPTLEERKRIGLRVMIFLGVFFVLLLYVKKKLWSEYDARVGIPAH
ncbi:MAG: cytochrome c1 [Beijerinckiaceae bacterium]|nr:cytochrome c1 [Beijerinckiaceae bacterium]